MHHSLMAFFICSMSIPNVTYLDILPSGEIEFLNSNHFLPTKQHTVEMFYFHLSCSDLSVYSNKLRDFLVPKYTKMLLTYDLSIRIRKKIQKE